MMALKLERIYTQPADLDGYRFWLTASGPAVCQRKRPT